MSNLSITHSQVKAHIKFSYIHYRNTHLYAKQHQNTIYSRIDIIYIYCYHLERFCQSKGMVMMMMILVVGSRSCILCTFVPI